MDRRLRDARVIQDLADLWAGGERYIDLQEEEIAKEFSFKGKIADSNGIANPLIEERNAKLIRQIY